jgi:hypothetical protein
MHIVTVSLISLPVPCPRLTVTRLGIVFIWCPPSMGGAHG